MNTEPLAWNEQFAGRLVTAESGDATYYIDSGHGLGVAAYVGMRDSPAEQWVNLAERLADRGQ